MFRIFGACLEGHLGMKLSMIWKSFTLFSSGAFHQGERCVSSSCSRVESRALEYFARELGQLQRFQRISLCQVDQQFFFAKWPWPDHGGKRPLGLMPDFLCRPRAGSPCWRLGRSRCYQWLYCFLLHQKVPFGNGREPIYYIVWYCLIIRWIFFGAH